MSAPNANIAARFLADGKPLQGSNYRNEPILIDPPPCGLAGFTPKNRLISYNTDIALLVQNLFTMEDEVWLTSTRYSPTTDRHTHHLMQAYRERNRTREVLNLPPVKLYKFTFAHHPYTHRAAATLVVRAIDYVRSCIAGISTPRIHAATRERQLANALAHIADTVRTATEGIDRSTLEDHFPVTLDKLDDLYELRATLQNWVHLPPEELRAAAQGYRALNDIRSI